MGVAADLSLLAHIAMAMGLIGGQLGSRLMNRQASRQETIDGLVRLTRAAAPFDQIGNVSGLLILPTGLLAAWAAGYPWLGLTTGWIVGSLALIAVLVALIFLVFRPDGDAVEAEIQAAVASGEITPSLRAAFRPEGARRWAYLYGDLAAPAIIALMVVKPSWS